MPSPIWGRAFGMFHQQALAQVAVQAAQVHSQKNNHVEPPSSISVAPAAVLLPQVSFCTSNVTTLQHIRPSMPDPTTVNESSDIYSDHRSQPSSSLATKPANDGYNWRKYGQKHNGGKYQSYYQCTHPCCPAKRKLERTLDGQLTEIIYMGQHNHQQTRPSKRGKDAGNANRKSNNLENSELTVKGPIGNINKSNSMGGQEVIQATHDHPSGSSDSQKESHAESGVDHRNDDAPEANRRRNMDMPVLKPASSDHVQNQIFVVQTISEVDFVDDGYSWRKYGQKEILGHPYPRGYYRCRNPGCNACKEVQRDAIDPKAVITRYKGKHNHDVPAARNSSHNTVLELMPQSATSDRHILSRNTDFGNNSS